MCKKLSEIQLQTDLDAEVEGEAAALPAFSLPTEP